MPLRALRSCSYPGCPNLVRSGRCAEHQQLTTYERDPDTQRLYSTRWKKRRKAQLAREPWCADCLKQGIYTEATDVDHVAPHRGDRLLFWTGALQSLCHSCHSTKTRKETANASAG